MPEKLSGLEDDMFGVLRRIARSVDLYSRHLLDLHGVTAPQVAALRLVAQRENASASDIARALHLSPSTFTGILSRLERRGLVARARRATDRRGVVITITPAGRELLSLAPPPLQERFRNALAALPEWEQTSMLATLQRIAAMMDTDELAASRRERQVMNNEDVRKRNHS